MEENAFSTEDVKFRCCFVDGSSYLSFKIWPGEIKYGCVLQLLLALIQISAIQGENVHPFPSVEGLVE